MGQMTRPAGCFLIPPDAKPMPEQIEEFERQILSQCEPAEMPLEHLFSDGIYARKILIPAGVMATGRVHKYRALNVLLTGEISDMTPAGVVRRKAPMVWVGAPGTKRLLYAHTDTLWMTVHATSETDPAGVKDSLTAATYEEFLKFNEQQKRLA